MKETPYLWSYKLIRKIIPSKGKIITKGKGEVEKGVNKALEYLKKKTYTLAIRELEKGYLMYTDGNITLRGNVYNADITMIDNKVHKIRRASNTAFRIGHPTLQGETRYATTQGLNQLEVFAQKNPIHTATQLSTKIFETMGYVIDLQGMEKSMASGTPDYKGLGSLALKKFFGFFPSWVGKFAGNVSIPVDLMVNEISKNFEEMDEEAFWEAFFIKKEEGMEAMKIFLDLDPTIENRNRDQIEKLRLSFLRISTPTLQKLLAKEFNYFEELNEAAYEDSKTPDAKSGIVYRKIKNKDYKRDDYFIYCIFINEENL